METDATVLPASLRAPTPIAWMTATPVSCASHPATLLLSTTRKAKGGEGVKQHRCSIGDDRKSRRQKAVASVGRGAAAVAASRERLREVRLFTADHGGHGRA